MAIGAARGAGHRDPSSGRRVVVVERFDLLDGGVRRRWGQWHKRRRADALREIRGLRANANVAATLHADAESCAASGKPWRDRRCASMLRNQAILVYKDSPGASGASAGLDFEGGITGSDEQRAGFAALLQQALRSNLSDSTWGSVERALPRLLAQRKVVRT